MNAINKLKEYYNKTDTTLYAVSLSKLLYINLININMYINFF
jgi:hypothetical protein